MSSISRPQRTLPALLLSALLSLPLAAIAQTPEIPEAPPPSAKPEAAPRATEAAPAPPSAEPAPAAPNAVTAEPAPSSAAPAVATAPGKSSVRLSPSVSGETGLLRIAAAEAPGQGAIRLGFGLDFFSVGSFFRDADAASRVGGTLSISVVPVDHLEVWLNTRAQSTRNTLTRPELLQALGDLTFGAKGHLRVLEPWSVGADMQLTFLTGVGSQTFDFGATQFQIRALSTVDLQRTKADVPVRIHTNIGAIVDGSGSLLTQPLSNAERFAQGASDFNRFVFGLGVEVPVKYVTPYLEYSLDVPLGYLATPGIVLIGAARQGLRASQAANESIAADPGRPALPRVIPQKLTPGIRVTAIPDLTIDAAVEISLTSDYAPGVLAIPPYNVMFLFTYALDPFSKRSGPPVTIPVVVPEPTPIEPPPTTGHVTGVVLAQDGKAVEDAVITFDRAPPVATGNTGRFLSHEIEPGPVKVTVKRDGFEPAAAEVAVAAGQTQEIKVALTAIVRQGTVKGRVVDLNGKAVAGAALEVSGASQATGAADASGQFEQALGEGEHLVMVNANGFYRTAKRVKIEKGKSVAADFTVRPRANPAIAEVGGNQIRLKKRIPFAANNTLTPQAAEVLDAVADILWARPELKIRVEAHTDNAAPEPESVAKTQAQAAAVTAYLASVGITAERLDAAGIGSAKAIAPNLTQRGREQNRRVEIVIR